MQPGKCQCCCSQQPGMERHEQYLQRFDGRDRAAVPPKHKGIQQLSIHIVQSCMHNCTDGRGRRPFTPQALHHIGQTPKQSLPCTKIPLGNTWWRCTCSSIQLMIALRLACAGIRPDQVHTEHN